MSQYNYATVLEAQSDGKPPNDNITEGQKIVKAGKHDTDQIEYITEDGDLDAVGYESVEVFKSETSMSEREAQEFAKEQWFEQQDNE
jgi:hypothetical protein